MAVQPATGSLEAENERLAANLGAQASQVTRLQAGLETWMGEATRLQSEATRLQSEGAAQARQITLLEAGMETWMREAMRLRGEFAIASATPFEAEVEAWTREAVRLRAELAVQADQATQLANELAACKGEVANLAKERDDLYASTSWRLTVPLRGAKALVSGTLKKLGWLQ
jgi:chromosome segregation ATPase